MAAKDRPVLVAVIGACAVVIAALIGLAGTGHFPWPHSCSEKMQITNPSEGRNINGKAGVLIKGKACNLNGHVGWLFDHDLDNGYYYEDYVNNPGPIVLYAMAPGALTTRPSGVLAISTRDTSSRLLTLTKHVVATSKPLSR